MSCLGVGRNPRCSPVPVRRRAASVTESPSIAAPRRLALSSSAIRHSITAASAGIGLHRGSAISNCRSNLHRFPFPSGHPLSVDPERC